MSNPEPVRFSDTSHARDILRMVYIQNANLPTEWANGYQIMKTCEAFVAAGVEVTLVLPKRKNPDRGKVGLFGYYHMPATFRVIWRPVIDLLPFLPVTLQKIPYILGRWSFHVSLKKLLRGLDRSTLIYTRDPATADAILRQRKDLAIFLELHDTPLSSAPRWQRVSAGVRGFIVISNGLKSVLEKSGVTSDRICVAHDGYDNQLFQCLPEKATARTRLALRPDIKLIVYAGQLFPWKGIDELARVFDQIPRDCELVCIGGQPADLDRISSLLPSDRPNVRFLGQAPREQVLLWLAAADAGLLPSSAQFAIGREYTSPLKLFEYLAAGLPVLASDVPSSRELLTEKTALFFQADNGSSFIQTVRRFLSLSREQKQSMADEARRLSKNYSWRSRGEKIVSFLSTQLRLGK